MQKNLFLLEFGVFPFFPRKMSGLFLFQVLLEKLFTGGSLMPDIFIPTDVKQKFYSLFPERSFFFGRCLLVLAFKVNA